MNEEKQAPEIYGLILTGGRSQRMGYDKSTISYHGRPQLTYLYELLKKFCSEVFTSCKGNANIGSVYNPIYDAYELDSPLNGILTAMQTHENVSWLTVPIDMPFIDEKTISTLVENRDVNADATCFFDSDGKLPEPLVTIWEPGTLGRLILFYESGNISPRKFLIDNNTKLLAPPSAKFHVNVNDGKSLEQFRNERFNQKS